MRSGSSCQIGKAWDFGFAIEGKDEALNEKLELAVEDGFDYCVIAVPCP
jgi:hypothetical protein